MRVRYLDDRACEAARPGCCPTALLVVLSQAPGYSTTVTAPSVRATRRATGRLDVELGAPPVAALGVVLQQKRENERRMGVEGLGTHLDLGVRLQAEPLGDGAITHVSIHLSHPLLKSVSYSPVLAGRLREDALRAESLLGRLKEQE